MGSILIHAVGFVMAEIINPLTTGAPAATCLRPFRLLKRCSREVRYSGIFPSLTA